MVNFDDTSALALDFVTNGAAEIAVQSKLRISLVRFVVNDDGFLEGISKVDFCGLSFVTSLEFVQTILPCCSEIDLGVFAALAAAVKRAVFSFQLHRKGHDGSISVQIISLQTV